jgi:hypothetical protein
MNPQTKAWLIVITTALATGCAVTGGALAGGCKTSIAILTGVGAGASAVLHSLLQSPNQTNQPENQAQPQK